MKYDNLELRKELISAIVEQIKIKELKQHDAAILLKIRQPKGLAVFCAALPIPVKEFGNPILVFIRNKVYNHCRIREFRDPDIDSVSIKEKSVSGFSVLGLLDPSLDSYVSQAEFLKPNRRVVNLLRSSRSWCISSRVNGRVSSASWSKP
jgi:hypothetical protein